MNRAALKLRKKLDADKEPRAYGRFADSIESTGEQLSKWLSDTHRPSLPYRVKIQERCPDIGILLWDETVEEQQEGAA